MHIKDRQLNPVVSQDLAEVENLVVPPYLVGLSGRN